MKKLIICLAIFALMAGCQNSKSDAELTELPTKEEYEQALASMTQQEQDDYAQQIVDFIAKTPEEDIYISIDDTLDSFKSSSQFGEISSIDATYGMDNLLMQEGQNYKAVGNIDLSIDVYFASDVVDSVDEFISELMGDNLYANFKVGTIDVRFYDENNVQHYEADQTRTNSAQRQTMVGRDEEEFALQTIAFDYVEAFNEAEFSGEGFNPQGNVTLKRFGLLEGQNELYMEIPIYEANYDSDVSEFVLSLGDKATELKDMIMESGSEYLSEKGISGIKIVFYTPWNYEDSEYIEHTFEI